MSTTQKPEWKKMINGWRCGRWQVFQMHKGKLWYVYFGKKIMGSSRQRRKAMAYAEELMKRRDFQEEETQPEGAES